MGRHGPTVSIVSGGYVGRIVGRKAVGWKLRGPAVLVTGRALLAEAQVARETAVFDFADAAIRWREILARLGAAQSCLWRKATGQCGIHTLWSFVVHAQVGFMDSARAVTGQ